MSNKLQNAWRPPIIFILLVGMLLSMFLSRATLSVVMILFVAVSLAHGGLTKQLRSFFSSPLLWGMSLLFLLPVLSGFWSEDKMQWEQFALIKLPLLFLPLAFAGSFGLSFRQWGTICLWCIAIVTAATCWTFFQYLVNMEQVNATYLQAKTMHTPLGNDHVRFSWLVAVTIFFAGWMAWELRKTHRVLSIVLAVLILWLIVFLHLLAARMGIACFYITMLVVIIRLFCTGTHRLKAVLLVLLLLSLPVIAYFIFPSFQNRVKYLRYDFDYFREAHYRPGSSDGMRMISWKAGWALLQKNPVKGVGFGDITSEINKEYALQYPDMLAGDRLWPSSEWLVYGVGNGWPGLLVFTLVMLIPFFIRTKHRWAWWLLNILTAFSFLFDIGLEGQYGVFLYAFVLLCSWKWMIGEKV